LGWKIHTVTILLPVILLAVANDYGIHIMARYQEDNAPGTEHSPGELARRGIVELTRPVLATGVTTIVGMLCLLSHMIVPAKQLGILAAVGVFFAMIGSLLFIPAVLAVLPRSKPVYDASKATESKNVLDRMLAAVARWIPQRPKAILLVSVVVSLGVGVGATRIVVDTNPMSFYQQSEPIWRSTHLLNQHLGGWAGVSVVLQGDIKDPKVLKEMDDLEQHLAKHPLVGMTNSLAGVMRKMNVVMHDGDKAFDRVPETRELIAQYLLLYSMSGDEKDFEKLVDFDYKNAQIMAKVTDSGTMAATNVLNYTRAYLKERKLQDRTMAGGLLDVMADMVHHIVWGQIMSLALAALLVTLVVSLLMRSLAAGLLSVSPLLLALVMIFGVMGFAGIELNLVTALLSSIMIGVGVDYTIHFLWRYRDERFAGYSPEASVERTLSTTGRGIVFNGLSVVVGFAVLIISAFYPVRFFGLLVAISILASLVAALVVVPALALVWRPRFLEPKVEQDPTPSSGALAG
jgi:hydrophobe/amphiphile efflux-3 (HAE3) family protein